MTYLKDFQTQITKRDYAAFTRLWEEYCESDELDPEEFYQILKSVKASEFAEPFGRYVERILPLWELMSESVKKHQCFMLITDLQTTNQESLRDAIFSYLQTHYGHEKNFAEKIKIVGLRTKESFQGVVSGFDLLNHMEKGNFVFHNAGWGVGEIIDVSLLREQLSLEFDYVAGKKDLSFANAFKNLTPIPKDHFLALRFGSPDFLEAKAKENPVEVIHLLLRDLGPKTAAEIKDELCEVVIPETEWTRWWQTARTKIKKDTMIQMPEDLKAPFCLRTSEVTHEEKLLKALDNKPHIDTFIQHIYTHIRDFPETLKKEEFKNTLFSKLVEAASQSDLKEAQKLQLHFFIEDLSGQKNYAPTQEMVRATKSLEELVNSLEILSSKKRVLSIARKIREDWKAVFLAMLFTVSQNPLRDYLLDELSTPEFEPELRRKLEDLWVHPSRYPDLFFWYFQKILAPHSKFPFADKEGKCRFFEAFFVLLSFLEQAASHKELIKKMYALLKHDNYKLVRDIIQNSKTEAVQEFLLLSTKCQSLTDHDIKILQSVAEYYHPSLAKTASKQETADQNVIWTTEAGYHKVKARMQQIATVETIENAKEIEIARSHGDLKENQEYKAAKEKRSRLQGELKALSDQIHLARVLTPSDVSTQKVGPGTVVLCKTPQGKEISYALLGPWDAEPEKGIISFQSKLAQTIKDLSVGDKFQFQGEEFTITAIKSYFDIPGVI